MYTGALAEHINGVPGPGAAGDLRLLDAADLPSTTTNPSFTCVMIASCRRLTRVVASTNPFTPVRIARSHDIEQVHRQMATISYNRGVDLMIDK